MALNPRTLTVQVLRNAGVIVNSDPIYVGSQPVEAHLHGPAAAHSVQQSQDGVNWVASTDVANVAITAVAAGYYELRESPQYLRLQTSAGGAAIYAAEFVVRRTDH